MAALNRPKSASYEVHETVSVNTTDNEDHTFCGIMFPIRAKAVLPVEKIIIHSIAVRGQLGRISIWVSNEDENPDAAGIYRIRLTPRHWTKIYDQYHPPSQHEYKMMDLLSPSATAASGTTTEAGISMDGDGTDTENKTADEADSVTLVRPLILYPGQTRGIYIHSRLPGDEAIVYDNSPVESTEMTPRYEDSMIAIYPGRAHLSTQPFGQSPIWGWGNAWRDRREFVGQIHYGSVFRLWNPDRHFQFGPLFRTTCQTLLTLQRRPESPFALLNHDCIYYILNMCRWDWFRDTCEIMKQDHRARKQQRLLRQQPTGVTDSTTESAGALTGTTTCTAASPQQQQLQHLSEVASTAVEENSSSNNNNNNNSPDDGNNNVNQAHDDDAEDDEASNESEWERANGYRADATAFTYRYISSDDERATRRNFRLRWNNDHSSEEDEDTSE